MHYITYQKFEFVERQRVILKWENDNVLLIKWQKIYSSNDIIFFRDKFKYTWDEYVYDIIDGKLQLLIDFEIWWFLEEKKIITPT